MVAEKVACTISLMPAAESQRHGVAELPGDSRDVLRCVEKPKEPRSNPAVIGVYAFEMHFFEVYLKPSTSNEMELTDATLLMISEGVSPFASCFNPPLNLHSLLPLP